MANVPAMDPERALVKNMDTVTLGRHQLEMARKAADFLRKARYYQGIADLAKKELDRRKAVAKK